MSVRYYCGLFLCFFLCCGVVHASENEELKKGFIENCVAKLNASEILCSCSYDNYVAKEADAAFSYAKRTYDIKKPQVERVLKNQEKYFEQDETVDNDLVSTVCGIYEDLQDYYDLLSKDSVPGQKMSKEMAQKTKLATDKARGEVHNLLHAKGVGSGSYGLLSTEHGYCRVKKELKDLEMGYQEAIKVHEAATSPDAALNDRKIMILSDPQRHGRVLDEGKRAGCGG